MLESTNYPACLSSRRFGDRIEAHGRAYRIRADPTHMDAVHAGGSFAGRAQQPLGMEPTQGTDGRK